MRWQDDEDDEGWRDEHDDAPEEDDEAEVVQCRYCRREIYEDAEQCPHCGKYQSQEDSAGPVRPWWIWVGAIVCLYVVYRWIVN
jgi:hypothetical protein